MKKNFLKSIMTLTMVTQPSFAADLIPKSSGVSPGKEMKMKKGVPTYSISSKKKDIPRLNIGEEPTLAADPKSLTKAEIKAITLPKVDRSLIPNKIDIKSQTKSPPKSAAKNLDVVKINTSFQAPEAKPLKEILDPTLKEPNPNEQQVKALNPSEEKMLQAMIFLEVHQMSNMAIGLFSEVMQENKDLRLEATFQFATTAKNLGLHSDHRSFMLKILKEGDKSYQKRATHSLALGAQEGDQELVGILDPKITEFDLDLAGADQFQLNRSRYYTAKGDLTLALAATEEVEPKSPLYIDANFMKAILLYRAGKIQESTELMTKVVAQLEQKAPDSELKSVAALTLARLQFQQAQYKEAFQTYLKVNKNNPLWTQAMMEQAWTQIVTQDYEGASGNMYSLHTDFFKNSFAPESYVVRAVGYLNLCQYGDGARAVYSLQQRYTPMKDMLEQYQKKNQSEINYYDTVRSFFQNKDLRIIDGLHRNFIYEIARHPSFIHEQKSVNSAEEQIERYNKISMDLVSQERMYLQQQNETEQKLAQMQKAKTKPSAQDIQKMERKISSFKTQYQIAKRARTSIKDIRTTGVAKLETDKAAFKKRAAAALKKRFEEMLAVLDKTLDQAELLRYELYSGAGEHLRFQLAGGEITDKEREALKAKDGKSLKWDFKGEVWEDELGHYRSSLKNVCPKDDKLSQN